MRFLYYWPNLLVLVSGFMIQIVAKAKKQSETFNLPVAQCHESKEYEDSANPGDQADDHDNGIAVGFFDFTSVITHNTVKGEERRARREIKKR